MVDVNFGYLFVGINASNSGQFGKDGNEADDLNELSLPPRPSKAPRQEKGLRPIVESLHLSGLVASYNVYFAKYCKGRKQVTQLVPSLMWKEVFKEYK